MYSLDGTNAYGSRGGKFGDRASLQNRVPGVALPIHCSDNFAVSFSQNVQRHSQTHRWSVDGSIPRDDHTVCNAIGYKVVVDRPIYCRVAAQGSTLGLRL